MLVAKLCTIKVLGGAAGGLFRSRGRRKEGRSQTEERLALLTKGKGGPLFCSGNEGGWVAPRCSTCRSSAVDVCMYLDSHYKVDDIGGDCMILILLIP